MSGDGAIARVVARVGAAYGVATVREEPAGLGACGALVRAGARLVGAGEACDLVVWSAAENGAGDWRARLHDAAKSATKVVLVVAPNDTHGRADAPGATGVLAPVLWTLGRVREHAYVDVPAFARAASRLVRRVRTAGRAAPAAPVAASPAAAALVDADLDDVVRAPAEAPIRRWAKLHVFVVETLPRTPQARRRLRQIDRAT